MYILAISPRPPAVILDGLLGLFRPKRTYFKGFQASGVKMDLIFGFPVQNFLLAAGLTAFGQNPVDMAF